MSLLSSKFKILSTPRYLSLLILCSFVIGVTNVIPVFGPYIGATPTVILIFVTDPPKGIMFLIYILILLAVAGLAGFATRRARKRKASGCGGCCGCDGCRNCDGCAGRRAN